MAIDAWGVSDSYFDAQGVQHEISPATREAILTAMGVRDEDAPRDAPVQVLRAGQQLPINGEAELVLEDGSVRSINGSVPEDLPLGYHQLRSFDRPPVRIIVAPTQCYLPEGLRIWGWAAQLYAARSAHSWGIGDLADLKWLAAWSAERGAGMIMVNPLQAATPVVPQESSPYLPSSRRYRNLLYLRIEDVPGAADTGLDLSGLISAGTALNGDRRIDRDKIFRLKMTALEQLWQRFQPTSEFDHYRKAQGVPLTQFAVFCVLAERYGRDWREWPVAYRHPDSPTVAEFAIQEAERVRFHQWVQWLLDVELREACALVPVMHDLPVGFDAGGADAWAWQDLLANGVAIGAPPDEFNAKGQNWGFPPFIPHKLRGAGYEPFAETLRTVIRHAGGLRIDHVMALFRLFWIPAGMEAVDGAYVHYPAEDLLSIVALESHRANAIIVGEDLGTVAEGVRERLAEHRILSYRILWFEPHPPREYPELALAAATNHDLPTIAGLWNGADFQDQEQAQLTPDRERFREMRDRLRGMAGLDEHASDVEAIEGTYRLLAESPSAIIMATLDDALAVSERPNLPGTTTERANWSLALPQPLEHLQEESLASRIALLLRR